MKNKIIIPLLLILKSSLVLSICLKTPIVTDSTKNSKIGKEMLIKSAQLANKSFEFSQTSYFSFKTNEISTNIDSAIFFIQQSITCLDSSLILVNDTNTMAIHLAKNARNSAIDSYRCLKSSRINNSTNKQLVKKAMYFSEHATIDSYHSSLYIKDKLKKKDEKEEIKDSVSAPNAEKLITKLDVDQSVFTILKEDLIVKKESIEKEITKLTDELFNTTDVALQNKLKERLKELENQKNDIEKKQNETQEKLGKINNLIDTRDKNKLNPTSKESVTIASYKSPIVTDEWNKHLKSNAEMPEVLIYQIQLGVFKSKVLPETFKGLTPIYTTISDKGICYSIGLFEKLSDATEARTNIVKLGLKDAFIVAYLNKKRIAIAEAKKLEK